MNDRRSLTSGERDRSARRGKRFSDDFKREAIRVVTEEDYTFKAAAAAVNVSRTGFGTEG